MSMMNMMRETATVYLLVCLTFCAAHELKAGQSLSLDGSQVSPLMRTNISLVGADIANTGIHHANDVRIDPMELANQAAAHDERLYDIEEDEDDRFITSRSGKLRPRYQPNSEEWAEEPTGSLAKILSRKKRCGGYDDDDRGRRSRRTRRSRRARRSRKARKSKKAQKKQVTRKVIQNGQVISSTVVQPGTSAQVNAQPAGSPQPVIVQQQAAVVQQQPATVQQQPAAVSPGQPQMIQQNQQQIVQQIPQQQHSHQVPQQAQVAQQPQVMQTQTTQTVPQPAQNTSPVQPGHAPIVAPQQVANQSNPAVSAEGSVNVSI